MELTNKLIFEKENSEEQSLRSLSFRKAVAENTQADQHSLFLIFRCRLRRLQRFLLIELVYFLRRQAGFGNHIFATDRETVIEGLIITNTDRIRNLIPVVVRVQSIASLGLLGVMQTAITAGQ